MAENEFFGSLPFTVQDGEKIVDTVKPIERDYIVRNSLGGIVGSAIAALLLGIYLGLGLNVLLKSLVLSYLISYLIVLLVGSLFSVLMATISYNKFSTWISNQRVISARGVIGYNTQSMPLENINDVVLNMGILDRILGLSSLMVVPIGGMIGGGMYGRRSQMGTVGFIPALRPDMAAKVQKEIFDLRTARKKEMHSAV